MVYRTLLDDSGFKLTAWVVSAASTTVSAASSDWALTIFGVPFPVLVAGFAGALIAVAMMPPTTKWYVSLGAGTGISAYTTSLGALVLDKYTPLGDLDDRVVAFLIGLLAYFLFAMVFKDGRDIVVGWLKSKFGGAREGGR